MDFSLIFEIVKWALILALGILACYLRAHEDVMANVERAIANAEDTYKDVTKAGGEKFTYAVDWLYSRLPAALKLVISKSAIEGIVQNAFNVMESYVYTRMDEETGKVMSKLSKDSDDSGVSVDSEQ